MSRLKIHQRTIFLAKIAQLSFLNLRWSRNIIHVRNKSLGAAGMKAYLHEQTWHDERFIWSAAP